MLACHLHLTDITTTENCVLQGKGVMTTYWVNGKTGMDLLLPDLSKAASIEAHEFK